MDAQVIQRKRGQVRRLMVEIDASQYRSFADVCEKLSISKSEGVETALNIWIGMVLKALSPKES